MDGDPALMRAEKRRVAERLEAGEHQIPRARGLDQQVAMEDDRAPLNLPVAHRYQVLDVASENVLHDQQIIGRRGDGDRLSTPRGPQTHG